MAQAGNELDNVEDGQAEGHGSGAESQHTTDHGSAAAYMPHNDLTQEELDERHPSLVPPDAEQPDDLVEDHGDVVYQTGLRIADGIRSETSLQGRIRRPLLARLEEQLEQQSLIRTSGRARTIRPLGGGAARSATTSTPTAAVPTTTLTTTTTDGRTEVEGEVRVEAVGGGNKEKDGKNDGAVDGHGQIQALSLRLRAAQSALLPRLRSLLTQ